MLIDLSRPVFIFQNSMINSISNFKLFVLLQQRQTEREKERERERKIVFEFFSSTQY